MCNGFIYNSLQLLREYTTLDTKRVFILYMQLAYRSSVVKLVYKPRAVTF